MKAAAESVAVRVTDALTFDGPVLVTVTVGVSFETDWLNEAEGLPLKLESPEICAYNSIGAGRSQ